MNLLELDANAEGLFKYLKEQSEAPLDSIAILGICLLKIFDRGTDGSMTIEKFAEDFKRSMVESYKARTSPGSATPQ